MLAPRARAQLPTRVNALLQYATDADAANAEIRKIESDLTQAKQRVGSGRRRRVACGGTSTQASARPPTHPPHARAPPRAVHPRRSTFAPLPPPPPLPRASPVRTQINDMQVEARGLGEPTRRELGNKISLYRNSLDTVGADLGKAKAKFQRNALLGGGPGGGGAGSRPLDFDKSNDQRSRMMSTTDKLRGGTDTLNDAHSRLEETLEVGACARGRGRARRVGGRAGCAHSLPRACTQQPDPPPPPPPLPRLFAARLQARASRRSCNATATRWAASAATWARSAARWTRRAASCAP